MKLLLILYVLLVIFAKHAKGHPIGERNSLITLSTGIHSDVVMTPRSGPIITSPNSEEDEPGWLRRQLLRFGEMTSSVGNKLGGFTGRIANTLDKFCEVIKTIIPVIAAVCHVGQFQFCGSLNEAPQELADALSSTNLDVLD